METIASLRTGALAILLELSRGKLKTLALDSVCFSNFFPPFSLLLLLGFSLQTPIHRSNYSQFLVPIPTAFSCYESHSHSLVPMVEDDDATNPNDHNQLSTDTRVVEEEEDKPSAAAKTAKLKQGDEIVSNKNKTIVFCNKSDGKGWQCRKAAKEGHALCEHHLAQLRSYNSSNQSSSRKLDKPAADRPSGRRRGRGLKKPPSNPNEYYYYSGFGPLWGKKRGGSKPESNRNDLKTESPPSYSSQIDSPDDSDKKFEQEYQHDDDEEDDDIVDEEDNGEGAKKRSRKPIKARSLKSLM